MPSPDFMKIEHTGKNRVTFPIRHNGILLRFGSALDADLAEKGQAVPHVRVISQEKWRKLRAMKGFQVRKDKGVFTVQGCSGPEK